MKRLTLLLGICLLVTGAMAQRSTSATARLKAAPQLSASFKTLAGSVLGAKDTDNDDDCTPPPCTGIIDPWTCECFPDLKDPWENEVMSRRMRQAQQLEAAMTRGEGKDLLPASLVARAKKRHPGDSPQAVYRRTKLYVQALKA